MLNHFRTVLRNSQSISPTRVGDIHVPPTYLCKQLSGAVRKAHALLFGVRPDALKLDYRLWELLTMLDSTPLRRYVTETDNRLTYDLREAPFYGVVFGPAVTLRRGSLEITMSGEPPVESSDGRLDYLWNFTLAGSDIEARQSRPNTRTDEDTLVFNGGISAPYTVPRTKWRHVYAQVAPSNDIVEWAVSYRTPPKQTLAEVCAALKAQLSSAEELEIFKHSSVAVHTIWRQHHSLAWQLGSLCVALVHAIEQAKQR